MNNESININFICEKVLKLEQEVWELKEKISKLENQSTTQQGTTQSTTPPQTAFPTKTTTFKVLPEVMPKHYSKKYYYNEKFDYSNYRFNGQTHCKNRLVLAVVKQYCAEHKHISTEELMRVFYKELQGALGVVRKLEDIKTRYKDYAKRFFTEPNEIIYTTTGVCVVCNQWTLTTITGFIDRAKTLGYVIEKV